MNNDIFSVLEKFPRFKISRYGLLPNTPVNNTEVNLAEESCYGVSMISVSSALWTWPKKPVEQIQKIRGQ